MINLNEISSEWFKRVSKQHRNMDKILAEKVIRAFLLLECLAKQKLSFVFKGGTALMLHFNSTKEVNYVNLISLPILSDFVPIIDEPLSVNMPGLENILGDKLTAFAPNTTGIPYFKKDDSMSMEIIKQLYDIGNLFDTVTDLDTIKTTFHRFAKTEIDYRKSKGINENDVLEDIYQTALCIVSRGKDGKGDFVELQNGIGRISRFIFSESFHSLF